MTAPRLTGEPVNPRRGEGAWLIAGTSGDEQLSPGHPGPEPDWHLPAHARDPKAVRERMAAQVVAGADILLAHTYLTHRRALARVGEARRARELTRAAVLLARDAAEQGREGRDPERPWAASPVWVAGVLPVLGEDQGSGRLGAADAAAARDLHDHAGSLADAGVDVILVDGPRTAGETAIAVGAAHSMGIEAWAVVAPGPASLMLEERGSPEAILLSVGEGLHGSREGIDAFQSAGPAARGVLLNAEADVSLRQTADGWLAAGATLLGIGDGASPERLAILRAAIDDHELASAREREDEVSSWLDWVARGAAMAPPGRAAWLAERRPSTLVPGWEWTVVPLAEIRLMPAGRYRLVVSEKFEAASEQLGRLLEVGGVLVAWADRSHPLPDELQLLDLRDAGTQRWLIARRR